jgi:hypothetical protein
MNIFIIKKIMEQNNNANIVNEANPSIIWTQYMDYLTTKGRNMKAEYAKRMRANNPFTWNDLDIVNKDIHDELDYIMTWDDKFKNESIYKSNIVRLTESQLNSIIKESVRKILIENEQSHLMF